MVDEGMVLAWIEDFEQSAGRIATKVGTDLVDFVEHEHWISGANPPELLDETARHGTNVRSAMPADFGLIANSAQAHPRELATERISDRLSQAGLSHAWRTKKTQDRSPSVEDSFFERRGIRSVGA